jgi:hypothetical protein
MSPPPVVGHIMRVDPGTTATLRARLAAAGLPDPEAEVEVSETLNVDPQTGARRPGAVLWAYADVTQRVPTLADCDALGQLAHRVLGAVTGLQTPAARSEPNLNLTFVEGTVSRTVTYTADQANRRDALGAGATILRAGRYNARSPGDWECFR